MFTSVPTVDRITQSRNSLDSVIYGVDAEEIVTVVSALGKVETQERLRWFA